MLPAGAAVRGPLMSEEPIAPSPGVAPRPRAFDARSIYLGLLFFGLTVGGLYLLWRVQLLLLILFLALLFASGIAGPVGWLERYRVPRPVAILIIYAILIGLLAALIWFVLPRLLGQAADVASDLPRRVEDVSRVQVRIEELSRDYPILRDLDARLLNIAAQAGTTLTRWLLSLPEAIAKTGFTLVSVFTIAFLLLITKERLLTLILSLTHPLHRPMTQQVLVAMSDRLGAYLRAKVIVIVIVGSLVWLTLIFLGAAYPVLVAIFAGVMEALPRIGPWIARFAIFATVLPLGWRAVGIAMVAHVVIENLKGSFISPLIESDQVDIHPLTAFIAIIGGGILLGWVGALIAVPLAAALQVLVTDVIIPWRRERLAAAELAYGIGPRPPELVPGGSDGEG